MFDINQTVALDLIITKKAANVCAAYIDVLQTNTSDPSLANSTASDVVGDVVMFARHFATLLNLSPDVTIGHVTALVSHFN